MMLSAEAIADVVELLHPEDFYRSSHRKLFESMRSIYARGDPVDIITTTEELKRQGTLDEIGGPLYVRDLSEQVPTPAGAGHYARIVSQAALLRRLINAAADIMEMGYSSPEEPETVADEAEQRIYEVARREDKDQVAQVRDLIDEAMITLESIQNRETQYEGTPTGFRDLDSLMSGLQAGNLIVVAARPGVGKSSFVTNLARNVSVDAHEPVALFSLEMSRWEIGMRLLCGEARVPWDRIRNKRVGAEDWSNIVQAAEKLHDAPLSIVDSGNVTIVDIRARARRLATRQQGLGVIIVDYLQLMSHHRRVDNRQQEIAEISRSLKLLAKELSIPVIAVSQLNRDPERRQDKRPQLSDLRECVTGDTLVALADGRRVPIAELEGTAPDVLAVSPGGRVIEARSNLVWKVGRKPVFRLRLASGREIRATARHRFLGPDGWVRLGDVKVGDRLAIARRTPEPARTIEWPDDRVALLGQMVGDGSYLSGQPMRYTTASDENSRAVTKAAKREFGARVARFEGRGQWHQLLISGNGNRWHPKGANAWFRELGIFGQRSHEKRLPSEVFRLGNRQVALLLRHLWATDGRLFVRKVGTKGGNSVYFATASRGLAEDVAALLLRIGIVARIKQATQEGSRPWFNVSVSATESQAHFLTVVGAFGPRTESAAKLVRTLDLTTPNTNVDTLPRIVMTQTLESMVSRGVTTLDTARHRGISHDAIAINTSASSRSLVLEYGVLLGDGDLIARATNDLFWDSVIAVEPEAATDVFDLSVPGPASWLADCVISHNSGAIEQDADVVMFIHRDDTDVTTKGTADLIVAKHRNGPTDTVKLAFLPNLTQFRNYAPGPSGSAPSP
jgi:replicative DNA helicase